MKKDTSWRLIATRSAQVPRLKAPFSALSDQMMSSELVSGRFRNRHMAHLPPWAQDQRRKLRPGPSAITRADRKGGRPKSSPEVILMPAEEAATSAKPAPSGPASLPPESRRP